MEPSVPVEAGSIRGANDAPAGGHAREWWEQYLPLLIPLLLVSICIAYIWPSYPDLTPAFVGWMVLVAAALWFVALRVVKLLKSTEYMARSFNPNVRPFRLNKRQLAGSMISMGASKALVAILPMILSSLFGDYEAASMFTLLFVTTSFVFSTVFVLVWIGATPGSAWRVASPRGFLVFILVTTLLATGAIFAGFGLAGRLQDGSPASWSDLLRVAQREAEKVDKGAVLESVRADTLHSVDPPYSPQYTAFVADFVFRKPDGASIRIEALDTNPPKLRSVDAEWDYLGYENSTTLPPDLLATYAANLSYVNVSPRDAYRMTEAEGLAFAQEVAPGQPPDVHVTMFLGHEWQEWFGVPAGWNMEYIVKVGGDSRSLNLRVDGATGRIIEREQWPTDLGPTPTPSPSAAKATQQMQASTILLGDVEVPIVAGATGVLTWPGGIQNQPPELRYKALGSTSDIATFYDTNVQGKGWSRVGGYVEDTSAGRVYLWTPPDDFPHRLVLSIHALPVADDAGGRSSLDVNVSVVKWPYATRLPRLPDASNVVTEDQSLDGPYVTRVTTYSTAASVQDVKEFYEREMARSGWSVEYRTPVADDNSSLLLRFLDPAGGLSEIKYTQVDWSAEPSPEGGTLVTIAAYGPDLPRKADR